MIVKAWETYVATYDIDTDDPVEALEAIRKREVKPEKLDDGRMIEDSYHTVGSGEAVTQYAYHWSPAEQDHVWSVKGTFHWGYGY